jgi:hypothetical protein
MYQHQSQVGVTDQDEQGGLSTIQWRKRERERERKERRRGKKRWRKIN